MTKNEIDSILLERLGFSNPHDTKWKYKNFYLGNKEVVFIGIAVQYKTIIKTFPLIYMN